MTVAYDFLPSDRPYIIAEVGGNHGGDVDAAIDYVEAAAESGADAVKFQLYQAENLIRRDEPPLPLAGEEYDTQFERFKELELAREEWRKVIDTCESRDIDFAASVFDADMLEFAVDHMPFVKIASGDMTHLPLLKRAAETDKPLVISTGFSTFDEIREVVKWLPDSEVVLLHCMGCYPTDDEEANLATIDALAAEFDIPVGYSDHTTGPLAVEAAVARGARVIEKHFTFDKSQEIGDHRLSATPEEMRRIVDRTRRIAAMDGEPRGSEIYPCEGEIRNDMRRSLALAAEVREGERITEADLTALRPADGISPLRLEEVAQTTATTDLEPGHVLQESDFEGSE